MNIQQLIEKLHLMAKEVGSYDREVTVLRAARRDSGFGEAAYEVVRVVGFAKEPPHEDYVDDDYVGEPGLVFLRTDYPPAKNHPDDIAAERAAARQRADMLLLGETIFGGTTLGD